MTNKHCPTRILTAITGRVPLADVPHCEGECQQGRQPCTCSTGYGYPTTRRHPRTSIEAFNDAERAEWRHGPYRPHSRLLKRVSDSMLRWAAAAVAIAAGLLALSTLIH